MTLFLTTDWLWPQTGFNNDNANLRGQSEVIYEVKEVIKVRKLEILHADWLWSEAGFYHGKANLRDNSGQFKIWGGQGAILGKTAVTF